MTSKPDAQKILDRTVSSGGKNKHNQDVAGINNTRISNQKRSRIILQNQQNDRNRYSSFSNNRILMVSSVVGE